MKSEETKTMLGHNGDVVKELQELSRIMWAGMLEYKRTTLACIDFLLQNDEVLHDDLINELKDTHGYLADEVAKESGGAESFLTLEAEPPAGNLSDRVYVQTIVSEVVDILRNTTPTGQRDVVRAVSEKLPELDEEYQEEQARDKAIQELMDNVVRPKSAEQIRELIATAKNNSVEVCATA